MIPSVLTVFLLDGYAYVIARTLPITNTFLRNFTLTLSPPPLPPRTTLLSLSLSLSSKYGIHRVWLDGTQCSKLHAKNPTPLSPQLLNPSVLTRVLWVYGSTLVAQTAKWAKHGSVLRFGSLPYQTLPALRPLTPPKIQQHVQTFAHGFASIGVGPNDYFVLPRHTWSGKSTLEHSLFHASNPCLQGAWKYSAGLWSGDIVSSFDELALQVRVLQVSQPHSLFSSPFNINPCRGCK